VYTKSAKFYDAIYSFKNYAAEAEILRKAVNLNLRTGGRRLLDVACGTGSHLAILRGDFDVEGLDNSEDQIEVARAKLAGVPLHRGDMIDFDLGRTFDVVTCLFSSIGYMKTVERMTLTIANLARHVRSGGLLIVEPWLQPGSFKPGHLDGRFVDTPDLKIARMIIHRVKDNLSIFDEQYMVGTREGIEFISQHHELGLFTRIQYLNAFADAGMRATWDEQGLIGRGLIVGIKVGSEEDGPRRDH